MSDSEYDAAREMDAAARAEEYAAQQEGVRDAAAEVERQAALDNAQTATVDPTPPPTD